MASSTDAAAEIVVFFSERAAARMVVVLAMPTTRTSGGRGEIGAFDHEIGRPEVDAVLALLVDGHESDIDRAGFGRVGDQAGVRCEHELQRYAELFCKLPGKIDGNAVRLAVCILDDEEGGSGGREDDPDAQLAGGDELFHCRALFRASASGGDGGSQEHSARLRYVITGSL